MSTKVSGPFPEDLARAVVIRCAKRSILRFQAFRDVGLNDLVQEGLMHAREGWARFDPARGIAPSTYLYRCCWNRLNDMHRTRTRRGNHERHFVEQRGHRGEPDEIPYVVEDPAELAEWAAGIYARSVAYLEARGIDGLATARPGFPRTFSIAQALTLMAIKSRLRLSSRATRHVLLERAELRRAIELPRVPSRMVFTRFHRSVTRLVKSQKNSRSAA
jgi:hypothetical protein